MTTTWVLIMFLQGFGPPLYFSSQKECEAVVQQLAANNNGEGQFYCVRAKGLVAAPAPAGP